jgi:hypothetical protein
MRASARSNTWSRSFPEDKNHHASQRKAELRKGVVDPIAPPKSKKGRKAMGKTLTGLQRVALAATLCSSE